MAAPITAMIRRRALTLLSYRSHRVLFGKQRQFSDTPSADDGDDPKNVEIKTDVDSTGSPKLTGFAEAFVRHAHVSDPETPGESPRDLRTAPLDEDVPFTELFRKSSHVHLGAAHNQIVFGNIFHVVEDDLYIDFGAKFHCVCRRPEENSEKYHKGARVRLRLKDLELTDHFVGASRDLTLLEADAELIGLAKQKQK